MKMHSKDQIARRMRMHYASNRTQYERIAEDYIQYTSGLILKGLAQQQDLAHLEDMRFYIEWDLLRRSFPRYGPVNNQKYWFDWLNEHFPLLFSLEKGSNALGKLTLAKSVFSVEQLINEVKDVSKYIQTANPEATGMWSTPVDVKSLRNYIQDCEHRTGSHRYLGTLQANIAQAQLIIASLDKDNILHQQVKHSEYGRYYFLGLNLQSAPKLVRRAALGDCHQYDISSSVFVWKYDVIKAIEQELGERIVLRYTLDYIDYKKTQRKRLAQLTFGNTYDSSINIIKKAITAIGFGARATGGGYIDERGQWCQNSIAGIIHDREHRERFLEDDFVKGFIEEQTLINDKLCAYTQQNSQIPDCVRTEKGRVNKNKLVSYLYQQAESELLAAMIDCVDFESNQVLLITHDGFYTRKPVDLQLLRHQVKQLWPTAKIDHEEIRAFQFNKLEENPEHAAHMRWEYEQVALKLGKTLAEVLPPKQRFNPRTYTTTNEDYSGGYDDGTQAYQEPREFYLEDPEDLDDPKQRAFAELYQRYC
jgi:hypothetical protein